MGQTIPTDWAVEDNSFLRFSNLTRLYIVSYLPVSSVLICVPAYRKQPVLAGLLI